MGWPRCPGDLNSASYAAIAAHKAWSDYPMGALQGFQDQQYANYSESYPADPPTSHPIGCNTRCGYENSSTAVNFVNHLSSGANHNNSQGSIVAGPPEPPVAAMDLNPLPGQPGAAPMSTMSSASGIGKRCSCIVCLSVGDARHKKWP